MPRVVQPGWRSRLRGGPVTDRRGVGRTDPGWEGPPAPGRLPAMAVQPSAISVSGASVVLRHGQRAGELHHRRIAVATVVLALRVCVLATSAQPLRRPTFEPSHDAELRRL
jgi:hypothetical protein